MKDGSVYKDRHVNITFSSVAKTDSSSSMSVTLVSCDAGIVLGSALVMFFNSSEVFDAFFA